MNQIDWLFTKNFSKNEFSEDPNKFADPVLIHSLQELRNELGSSIYPSPVKGALARNYGSKKSQHYVGDYLKPVRKSTAIDIFPEGRPIDCLVACLSNENINGIGVYLGTTGVDGLPWIMFHIDIRPIDGKIPLIWIADKNNRYYYPQSDPSKWKLLQDERMIQLKRKEKKYV